MNNYQEETKSYYQQLYKKAVHKSPEDNFSRNSFDERLTEQNVNKPIIKFNLGNRLIQEFTITFLLCVFVFGCKIINTSQSQYAYKYAKNILDIDLTEKVTKYIQIDSIKKSFDNAVDTLKTKFDAAGNDDSTKQKNDESFNSVKNNIVSPINGNIVEDKDKLVSGKGVLISAKEGSQIFNPYTGVVRKVIKNDDKSNTVIVNNTDGVEVSCTGLSDVYVKEGDKVDKGEVLGKSTVIGKSKIAAIIFTISYKGEEKDPKLVINM